MNCSALDKGKYVHNNCESCFNGADEPLYSDVFSIIHGPDAFYDYNQAVCCSKECNRPLVLIFGGWGASNFQEMYQNVLSHEQIKKLLKHNFITTYLYVDDKTLLPEEERFKNPYSSKTIDFLGEKNSIIQTTIFQTGSQPFLVILSPDEQVLGKTLSYTSSIKEVVDWLDMGLKLNISAQNK